MGLDWCVQDKIIPGCEKTLEELDKQKEGLSEDFDEYWEGWLEANGHRPPGMWPHPVSDEFNELPETKKRRAVIEEVDTKRAACVVSAMETLGTPRISANMAEDVRKHAFGVYESHRKANQEEADRGEPEGERGPFSNHGRATRAKKWLETHPNFDAWVENNEGYFLSDFPNDSPGLGAVTGIMVAPTSFRGKCVGYIGFLSEDVKGSAYESKEPDDLVAYGRQILEEVERQAKKKLTDEQKEDVDLARSAGEWCVFWGENGHGMFAWY